LGEWLRQRREELDISLEQAETDTRIRLRYLKALESGEYDALPDPVVGRGFLRNYASYLQLDPQEASERYSKKVAPPEPESLSVEGPTPFSEGAFRPLSLHEMPGRRSRWVWIVGLVLIVAVALAALGWWGYPYIAEWLAQEDAAETPVAVTATPLAASESLSTATLTPFATETMAEETAVTPTSSATPAPTRTLSPTRTPSPPVYTGVFLELLFIDTSWIQVTVDGVRQFQGELEADTYRSWYGEERIELRVGNAGVVQITLNGQPYGTLGEVGEVIDRVFEKVGEDVTAATVTPIPTSDGTSEPTTAPTETPTVTPSEPVETASPEPAATSAEPVETASPEPAATSAEPAETESPEPATATFTPSPAP
jgi:cytoskeletal protein RodZ